MALIWLALAAFAGDPGLRRAHTVAPGEGSVGLFSPLVLGLDRQMDLTVANSILLGAPHVRLTRGLTNNDAIDVALTSSLGVPTVGLMAIQGTVLSTDPTQSVGPAITGSLGALVDVGTRPLRGHFGVEGRMGVHGADWGLTSPGWFWLDPMLAPLTEGPILDVRLGLDWWPLQRIGLHADRVLHAGGIGPDWHSRLLARWQLHPRWMVAGGLAVAQERFEDRWDTQWQPVVDLRVGWGG